MPRFTGVHEDAGWPPLQAHSTTHRLQPMADGDAGLLKGEAHAQYLDASKIVQRRHGQEAILHVTRKVPMGDSLASTSLP